MEAAGLIGINNTWLKSIGDVGTYGITDFNLCTSVGFYVVVTAMPQVEYHMVHCW